jgi:putative cell wall-binding protein
MVAWLLVLGPVALAEDGRSGPPDQVDPPAPGEGQPLDDPSDPPPPEYRASAEYPPNPTASVNLSGTTFPRLEINRVGGAQQYSGAVKASRMGWADGARDVVLVAGNARYSALAASSLAGAVRGPLLFTDADRLRQGVADELKRLKARKVFIVGSIAPKVVRQVRALGYTVEHIDGEHRYQVAALTAARAVELGANPGKVIVASGESWTHSLAVPAFAAGRGLPVLLAPQRTGAARLARQVESLGAEQVLVVGNTAVISERVVADLPAVVRLAGASPAATAAKVARRGQRNGLDGRPVLVSGNAWADAIAGGVMAGAARDAVVLVSRGRELSQAAASYLSVAKPRRITLMQATGALPRIAICQLRRGAMRSWYCAEETLARQGYVMPQVDGATDRFSVWAILAFEKVAGLKADGRFGETEWRKMLRNPRMPVRRPDLPANHVEINIGKQLILLVRNGKVRHAIHTSTGKSSTPTIRGTFTVYEKRNYRQANGMYRSIFFHGGYAMHGYPSIPTYPASAGCARTYDGNMDFIYPRVNIGDRVATY